MGVLPKLTKAMEMIVRFLPDKEPDPLRNQRGQIGVPLSRVDGRLKVTGEARFAAEYPLTGLAHAVLVHSTIAKGRIADIATLDAGQAPGVVAVVTHLNAPKMKKPQLLSVLNIGRGVGASDLPILQDDVVHYDGQPVAIVVGETLEQAEHAASLVRVAYDMAPLNVSFDASKEHAVTPPDVLGEEAEIKVGGDATDALARAAHTVDHTYRTPRYNHNALELHATTAVWDEAGKLTVFDATQFVNGFKHQLAHVFGLGIEDVRVFAPFVGGGFGGKFAMWSNTVLCAAAAKVAGRPVKLVLSREGVFRSIGGRTLSEQRVALGADGKGRLTALIHTGTTATTAHAKYPEQFSLTPRHLYAAETLLASQRVVELDTVANTWMRAPGESIATFALESAIDELSYVIGMDPIALRRINEPPKDPSKHTEFSGRHLLEAYARGAAQFGWSERPAAPASQRDGKWLCGQGVATAYYPYFRWPAKVRIRISVDGDAVVQAAANEMGMGAATVQIQHAAERLGLPIDKVSFQYGDSALPDSPITAGGSSQTVTVVAGVQNAVEHAHRALLELAHAHDSSLLAGAKYEQLQARDAGLFRTDTGEGETYATILRRAGQDFIEAEGSVGMPLEMRKYSMASYGAQFCEVRVNQESGEVRISRWLGSFDCGRILNPKTATSQFRGGIIMGIGMALSEETMFDERRGRIANRSLAEYHVPVHLDVPKIEVIYTDIPDDHSPLGARGVGEIGITGAAAAIANAIFHATGRRIRELPITLDKLL